MRDAGDVHLQPVGGLGDRQRPAATERQQTQQLESGEAQIVRAQRGFDAGEQDLVGPHHRRDRDHAFGDVAPPGAFPVGPRDSDRIAVVGFAGVTGWSHALSYRTSGDDAGLWPAEEPDLCSLSGDDAGRPRPYARDFSTADNTANVDGRSPTVIRAPPSG